MKKIEIELTDSQAADLEAIAEWYGIDLKTLATGALLSTIETTFEAMDEEDATDCVEQWREWAAADEPLDWSGATSGPFTEKFLAAGHEPGEG